MSEIEFVGQVIELDAPPQMMIESQTQI